MTVTLTKAPTNEEWNEVKRRALVTAGFTKVVNPPSIEWRHRMLEARHSPIRFLTISFDLFDVPYWLTNELCRHHVGVEKFVKSQRNDRQKEYDRNAARQDAPVNMIMDFNAEGFLTFCNKRLCNKASKEMRELVDEMKNQLIERCPEFKGLVVPMCFNNGFVCHELEPCGMCKGK